MNLTALADFNARLRAGWLPRVSGGVDPAPNLETNSGSNASPTWTSIMGAGGEIRWIDANTDLHTTGNAAWPQMTRPGSATLVGYLWGFSADTTGYGAPSSGSSPYIPIVLAAPPTTWNQLRWNNSASGTYASAPILTAYKGTGDRSSVSAGDGSLLGGSADTSNSSYLKGNAYGFAFATTPQTPSAAPTGSFPTAADHTAGSVATSTGAWQNGGAKWQDLCADANYITSGGASWDGASGKVWHFMVAQFTGPNMTPGTLTPTVALKYSYT